MHDVASRTDSNIDDDAAGLARATLAEVRRGGGSPGKGLHIFTYSSTAHSHAPKHAHPPSPSVRACLSQESRQRKAAEQAALTQENAAHKQRRDAAGPRTDFDISDEEAGRMRGVLAEESRQRKAQEQAEIEEGNAELRHLVKTVGSRSDHDIMDEDAGKLRLERAKESMARKAAETQALVARNNEIRARLRAAASNQRIDNKIDDEAATGSPRDRRGGCCPPQGGG